MKKVLKKRLTLHRETVKILDAKLSTVQLRYVAGARGPELEGSTNPRCGCLTPEL